MRNVHVRLEPKFSLCRITHPRVFKSWFIFLNLVSATQATAVYQSHHLVFTQHRHVVLEFPDTSRTSGSQLPMFEDVQQLLPASPDRYYLSTWFASKERCKICNCSFVNVPFGCSVWIIRRLLLLAAALYVGVEIPRQVFFIVSSEILSSDRRC